MNHLKKLKLSDRAWTVESIERLSSVINPSIINDFYLQKLCSREKKKFYFCSLNGFHVAYGIFFSSGL